MHLCIHICVRILVCIKTHIKYHFTINFNLHKGVITLIIHQQMLKIVAKYIRMSDPTKKIVLAPIGLKN